MVSGTSRPTNCPFFIKSTRRLVFDPRKINYFERSTFLRLVAPRAAREEEGTPEPVVQPARGGRGRHLHLQQHRAAVAEDVLAGEDRRRVLGHVQEDEGRLLVLRRDPPGRDLAGKRRGNTVSHWFCHFFS